MKTNPDAVALAASLQAAAKKPLMPVGANDQGSPQEPAISPVEPESFKSVDPQPKKARSKTGAKAEQKDNVEKIQKTIWPTRALWARYAQAAAERSLEIGDPVSPQTIMMEVLEKAKL